MLDRPGQDREAPEIRCQPHGATVVWDLGTDRVLGFTGNASDLFGQDITFDQPLAAALGQKNLHDVRNAINPFMERRPGFMPRPLLLNGKFFDILVEADGQTAAISAEPLLDEAAGAAFGLRELDLLARTASRHDDRLRSLQGFLRALGTITGYDAVGFARREADGWQVLSQRPGPGSVPIPEWLTSKQFGLTSDRVARSIYDRDASMTPLLGDGWATAALVAPDGTEDRLMKDLGARALLAFPVPRFDGSKAHDWVLCMNQTPRYAALALRQVGMQAARSLGMYLSLLDQRARLSFRDDSDKIIRATTPGTAESAVPWRPQQASMTELCDLLHADGLVYRIRGTWTQIGQASSSDMTLAIDQTASENGHVLATCEVARDAPKLAAALDPVPAGLMLARSPDFTLVAFRRPAQDADPQAWKPEHIKLFGEVHRAISEHLARLQVSRTTQRQKLLIHELNHRVRNILAIVRSLINQTPNATATLDDYTTALTGRIAAISKTHDLIVGAFKGTASVRRIIANEADAFAQAADHIIVEGQDAPLPSDQAVAFALVVHELMTNAVKYGALSRPEGRVQIDLAAGHGGLTMMWNERGGPSPNPTGEVGFGTKLINSIVPFQLNGHLAMDFAPTGLKVNITVPLGDRHDGFAEASPPLASASASPIPPLHQRQDAPIADANRKTCLVLEDEVLVAMDTRHVIENHFDTECYIASTTEGALRVLETHRVDFAVVDINLGRAGTSAKLAFDLMKRRIPFVFLTGYGESADLPSSFDGIALISKPIDRDVLQRHVDAWFPTEAGDA